LASFLSRNTVILSERREAVPSRPGFGRARRESKDLLSLAH